MRYFLWGIASFFAVVSIGSLLAVGYPGLIPIKLTPPVEAFLSDFAPVGIAVGALIILFDLYSKDIAFRRTLNSFVINTFPIVGSSLELLTDSTTDRVRLLRNELVHAQDDETAQKLNEKIHELETQLFEIRRENVGLEGDASDISWPQVFVAARERLIAETARLQSRSRNNLQAGIFTSLFGVLIIFMIIFWDNPDIGLESWGNMIVEYAPRLALVLIVEITSAFFFRMYVANENDIKQNKNELTNLELRFAAMLASSSDKRTITEITKKLATEERNFILRKGERTAADSIKTDIASLKGIVEALPKKLKNTAGSSQ